MSVPTSNSNSGNECDPPKTLNFPKPDWTSELFIEKYANNVRNLLYEMDAKIDEDICNNMCKKDKQVVVDQYCERLTSLLHEAVSLSTCNRDKPHGKRRKRHWWNMDCTIARDKLKLWFFIWNSCKRPREGVVHECYKSAKYLFRKNCRQAVKSNNQINFKKCSELFKSKRMHQMWNMIRGSRDLKKNQPCLI